MSRLEPLSPGALPADLEPILEFARSTMGFTPNDVLIMARWPALLQAMAPLVGTVFSPGAVGMELKRLVALMSSAAAGCQYCVAHNALGLADDAVADERQQGVWEFETHPAFSAAERAALRVARGAGQVPNHVSDADFAELRRHFDDAQVLEIVGVIALFGFLNRWNATLATELESTPWGHAERALGARGWHPGRHAPAADADPPA